MDNNFNLKDVEQLMIRGSIWEAELVGKGSVQQGKRPVIIVQNDIGNKNSPTIQAIALTSKKMSKRMPTHVLINPSAENGLELYSKALCEQIMVIDKEQIKDYYGQLEDFYIRKIDRAIKLQLALKDEEDNYERRNRELNGKVFKGFESKERKEEFKFSEVEEKRKNIIHLMRIYNKSSVDDRVIIFKMIVQNIDLLKEYCNKFNVNFELYTKQFEKIIGGINRNNKLVATN